MKNINILQYAIVRESKNVCKVFLKLSTARCFVFLLSSKVGGYYAMIHNCAQGKESLLVRKVDS